MVRTDDGREIECKIKGNFRLKGIRSTNPVAVGDYVNIILNQEGTAFISEIEDRKNYIIRRASNLSKQSHILAANLDQCMLIVTVNYPETSTTFIDRFLASAEAYRVPVKIIFNKVDAYNEEELHYLDSLINLYTTIGYPCFKVSARKGEGIDTKRARQKTSRILETCPGTELEHCCWGFGWLMELSRRAEKGWGRFVWRWSTMVSKCWDLAGCPTPALLRVLKTPAVAKNDWRHDWERM